MQPYAVPYSPEVAKSIRVLHYSLQKMYRPISSPAAVRFQGELDSAKYFRKKHVTPWLSSSEYFAIMCFL